MALSTDLDALLARVDALRDEIDAMRPLSEEQVGRAMQRLRIEWTYHSNAIEGNSLTYGETRALLMEGVTAHGKPLKDHLDIERHRDVVLYIEAFVNSDESLRVDFVKEIHHRLMGDEYEIEVELPDGRRERRMRRGGDYKEHPNNVRTPTGEIHFYAPPVEVPGRMAELMEWLRGDEAAAMHPVARLAIFHHRFVEIHPFPDGNGRTSRVLMNILSMRDGYVPAVLRQERRSVYYGALAEAGSGDDEPIISFVAGELAETMELYLRALRGEPDPTAFDRRVQLLRREVEGAKSRTQFSTDEVARYAERLLVPFLEEGERRVAQLSTLFGTVKPITTATRSDGNEFSGDEARAAIREGDAASFVLMWRFESLPSKPSIDVICQCKGEFLNDALIVNCLPKHSAFNLKPGQPLGEENVMALADATFDPVVEAVESAVRE